MTSHASYFTTMSQIITCSVLCYASMQNFRPERTFFFENVHNYFFKKKIYVFLINIDGRVCYLNLVGFEVPG
eukprot:SAG11_NODE_136_length_15118_cov_14.188495_2_plen_72_part_00